MIWLGSLLAVYAALVLFFWFAQDGLVFPGAGRGDRGAPAIAGLEIGTLAHGTGGTTRVATARPPEGTAVRAVALCFVGNGEDLFSAAWQAAEFARYGVLAIGAEYPGYGASAGTPSVDSLLATADAAAAMARARAADLQVPLFVVGTSLGSFPAVHVAAQGGVDRLLLRAPPSSLAAVAASHYPWLPIALLLRHRFDNLALAPRVTCPVLVVHGDADEVVPLRFGRELADAFAGPVEFVVATGRGHNDLPLGVDGPYGERVRRFWFGG